MRSSWIIQVVLQHNDKHPIGDGQREIRDLESVVWRQRERWEGPQGSMRPAGSHQRLEGAGRILPWDLQRPHGPDDTLTSDF